MKFVEFIKKNMILLIAGAALLAILCLFIPTGIIVYGGTRWAETRVNGFGILFGKTSDGYIMYNASGRAITVFVFFLIFLASSILVKVIKINDKVNELAYFISAGSLVLASFFFIGIKNYPNYSDSSLAFSGFYRQLLGVPLGGLIIFAMACLVFIVAINNCDMLKKTESK